MACVNSSTGSTQRPELRSKFVHSRHNIVFSKRREKKPVGLLALYYFPFYFVCVLRPQSPPANLKEMAAAVAASFAEHPRGFLLGHTRAFDLSAGQQGAFYINPEFTSTSTTTVVPVDLGLPTPPTASAEPDWIKFLKLKQRKEAELGPYCSPSPRNFIEHPAVPREYKRIVWEKCNGIFGVDMISELKVWDRLLNIFTFLLGKKFAVLPRQRARCLLLSPGQTPNKCFFRSVMSASHSMSVSMSSSSTGSLLANRSATADLDVVANTEKDKSIRETHKFDALWQAAISVEALLNGDGPGQVSSALGTPSASRSEPKSDADEAASIVNWRNALKIEFLSNKDAKKHFGALRQVGEGGFSRVYLTKYAKKKVAVKRIRMDSRSERKILAEICCHQQLKHGHIVDVFSSKQVENEYWIIMEALEGGNLYVARKLFRFSEAQIAFFAREILKGLAYIHSHHFVHRDITTNNIMLSSSTGEIRIIDFGLSLPVIADTGVFVRVSGTPIAIPPEAIQSNFITCAADIWGLGALILELVIGKANIPDSFSCLFMSLFNRPPIPIPSTENWSENLISFLHLCLQPDPGLRSTANALLAHPWFTAADIPDSMKPVLMQIFVQTALTTYGF